MRERCSSHKRGGVESGARMVLTRCCRPASLSRLSHQVGYHRYPLLFEHERLASDRHKQGICTSAICPGSCTLLSDRHQKFNPKRPRWKTSQVRGGHLSLSSHLRSCRATRRDGVIRSGAEIGSCQRWRADPRTIILIPYPISQVRRAAARAHGVPSSSPPGSFPAPLSYFSAHSSLCVLAPTPTTPDLLSAARSSPF